MFIFISAVTLAAIAAFAALFALLKNKTRPYVCAAAALLVSAAGIAAYIAGRLRFNSIEMQNEWARGAFTQFTSPLEKTAAIAIVILAAAALTAKRRSKAVVCLAAAAAFSLLCVMYTALFSYMTSGGALGVDHYIRVCGCGAAASFAAVAFFAEAKEFVLSRRGASGEDK